MRYRTLIGCTLMLLALVATGCKKEKDGGGGGGGDQGVKYSSPEEVFKAAQEAEKKKDYKGFFGCLTKDSQEIFAGAIASSGIMMVSFTEKFDKSGKSAKKIEPVKAVLEKHGLTKEARAKMEKEMPKGPPKDPKDMLTTMKKFAEPVTDKASFVAELLEALEKTAAQKSKDDNFVSTGTLKDVKKDGDKAKGTFTTTRGEEEKSVTMEFANEGGSWKIVITPELMGGPGGGG